MLVLKQFLSSAGLLSSSVVRSKSASFSSQAITCAMPTTPTIVLSGPSGSGKSTILTKAMAQHPDKFAFTVSHTTRKPRPGEADGEHYHFVDIATMKKMIEDGEFFEHAEFGGNFYGTRLFRKCSLKTAPRKQNCFMNCFGGFLVSKKAVEEVQKSGKICVLDVDLQGVINFKKSNLAAKYILIAPPAIEILKKRLQSRGTETEDSISKRLSTAKRDLEIVERNADLFDYVVVNDELDQAYNQFLDLIVDDLEKSCITKKNQVAV